MRRFVSLARDLALFQGLTLLSVAAAAPAVPPALLEQLDSEGGRLVIPVGSVYDQELLLIRKLGKKIDTRVVTGCRFVPLRGKQGWQN